MNIEKFSSRLTKYTIFVLIIICASLLVRLYFFPSEVPVSDDSLYYFLYASDVLHTGALPGEWTPTNNGWPIFVSIFFGALNSDNIFTLMQMQKLLSVIVSVAITIPVYLLCKKFVDRKFALVGAAIVAFDPRLMVNSFLGATDPLYILLISASLMLFLSLKKKFVYVSFVLVSFATIIRGEGLAFFVVISIMFWIRYRADGKKLFFRYLMVLGIFLLIIMPFSLYRLDVNGNDGIFLRSVNSGDRLLEGLATESSESGVIVGLELFIKYLVWVLIPNFIIFVPLGLFLVFKNRDFKKNTIILSLGIMSIPAFYAYTVPALDTRYLYVLFPMFCVLSVLAIQKISYIVNRPNTLIVIIMAGIIASSILFYDQIKVDYEHQEESFEIINQISNKINGVNGLKPESSGFLTSQTIMMWPESYSEWGLGKSNVNILPTDNFNSMKGFIEESKDSGLTHIIIDSKEERKDFLKDVFNNENNYPYLEKIYDSKKQGFVYHLKVFKINYEEFESLYNYPSR